MATKNVTPKNGTPKRTAPYYQVYELSPTCKEWERQPKETPEAFEAFRMYLLVKEQRKGGQVEVARRLGKHPQLMCKWSKRWQWIARYRAYQNYQLLLKEREQASAMREAARAWAGRRIEIREEGFEIGQALLDRARNLLRLPYVDKTIKETVTIGGKKIATVTELVFQQHPRDARLLAETGLKLMRLSADMSTENISLPEVDLDALSDAELDSYVERLLELRQNNLR
jgi:hypothetical protein